MYNPLQPLSEQELEFIDEVLIRYGNDDAILDVSELDGFFTALISAPQIVPQSQWFAALWGGQIHEPQWHSLDELKQFMDLLLRHWHYIAEGLLHYQDDFCALFLSNGDETDETLIAEHWCFGYMRGVELAAWPELPPYLLPALEAVALHGLEDNFPQLEKMTLGQHQGSVALIEPAVIQLYNHWLLVRNEAEQLPPGKEDNGAPPRDEPCPCGSGKPFKKCCLH